MGDDATCFLTTVLKGVQAERYEVGCVGDANNAKNATFLPQFIIVKGMGGGEVMGQGELLRVKLRL